jgi:hypothetical protein
MIEALSLHPSLNTPVETKRLEAARAAMANWKACSQKGDWTAGAVTGSRERAHPLGHAQKAPNMS